MKRSASEPGLRNYHFNYNFTAFNIIVQPRLMFYFSTNKTQSFFWAEYQLYLKAVGYLGVGGGGQVACAPPVPSPLDPPL